MEAKGLVERRPDPGDRRRNVVELTLAGHQTLRAATKAIEDAERRFLARLGDAGAKQLRDALRSLVARPPTHP